MQNINEMENKGLELKDEEMLSVNEENTSEELELSATISSKLNAVLNEINELLRPYNLQIELQVNFLEIKKDENETV